MKKAIWLLFIAAFVLSVSAVFAQSEVSAVSVQDEQSVQNTMKIQKVIDIRRVVVYGSAIQSKTSKRVTDNVNLTQKTESTDKLQYDAKGGIIVPNASKGIKITPQSSRDAKIEKAQEQSSNKAAKLNESTDNQQINRKDVSSRKAKSSVNTKKQKDN
ncbi:MAG: hypothetical protein AMJ53_01750 [Gammaproteobacteria bacterium SG8_11]|nr:MAG: hypothetical protein AMJ53_01750 [Gammaproteobacteria bacterium SG8_11]